MKKLILLLLLFAGMAVPGLRAQYIQQVDTQNKVDISGREQMTINLNENDFFSLATNKFPYFQKLYGLTSARNQAAIISQIGNKNTSAITQTGLGNYGAVYIDGNLNNTSLFQDGNDFSLLVVNGDNNNFDIDQRTDSPASLRNFIKLKANGVDMKAAQNSAGMKLFLTGGTSTTLGITITGQNIPVIISTY